MMEADVFMSADATALARMVHEAQVSPLELVEAAVARAIAANPRINAIAEPLYEQARAEAQTVDRSLPLAGVPVAIKDLAVAIKGVPIHGGSNVPARVADTDSVVVERFRAAGMIPIATSTTPEWGLRLVTESRRFGITHNPWKHGYAAGGSSGGAAALVAAGVVPVAHASDGGGSIRVPAACCGLVGLKPSRGRVPMGPVSSEMWFGMVAQHVVTRSVRDTATLLDLLHGPDPLAPYAARQPRRSFAAAAARAPGRLSIGIYRRSPLELEVSRETEQAMDAAIALVRDAGHAVEEIDLPMVGRSFMADFARTVAVAMAGTVREERERLGHDVSGRLERATRVVSRLGEVISGGELYAGLTRLQAASRDIIAHTARFDAVLMPLLAHPPIRAGAMDARGADEALENLLDRLRLTRLLRVDALFGQLMDKSLWFTHWSPIQNVTGQPAIALPVHVTDDGLPLGVQAVGRPGDEETLLALAGQMEAASGWLGRRAPLSA